MASSPLFSGKENTPTSVHRKSHISSLYSKAKSAEKALFRNDAPAAGPRSNIIRQSLPVRNVQPKLQRSSMGVPQRESMPARRVGVNSLGAAPARICNTNNNKTATTNTTTPKKSQGGASWTPRRSLNPATPTPQSASRGSIFAPAQRMKTPASKVKPAMLSSLAERNGERKSERRGEKPGTPSKALMKSTSASVGQRREKLELGVCTTPGKAAAAARGKGKVGGTKVESYGGRPTINATSATRNAAARSGANDKARTPTTTNARKTPSKAPRSVVKIENITPYKHARAREEDDVHCDRIENDACNVSNITDPSCATTADTGATHESAAAHECPPAPPPSNSAPPPPESYPVSSPCSSAAPTPTPPSYSTPKAFEMNMKVFEDDDEKEIEMPSLSTVALIVPEDDKTTSSSPIAATPPAPPQAVPEPEPEPEPQSFNAGYFNPIDDDDNTITSIGSSVWEANRTYLTIKKEGGEIEVGGEGRCMNPVAKGYSGGGGSAWFGEEVEVENDLGEEKKVDSSGRMNDAATPPMTGMGVRQLSGDLHDLKGSTQDLSALCRPQPLRSVSCSVIEG